MKDMTGDEYVERVFKKVYKHKVISVLYDDYYAGFDVNRFIKEEISNTQFVTCIRVNRKYEIYTEIPSTEYLASNPEFHDELDEAFSYCETNEVVIYNVRQWYDDEVVPEVKVILNAIAL